MNIPSSESREPAPSDTAFARSFFPPPTTRFEVTFGGETHIGKVRKNNEDHFAIVQRTRTERVLQSNIRPDEFPLLEDHAYHMIVADGIGGSRYGGFASWLVLRTVSELSSQSASWVMKYHPNDEKEIHRRVQTYARRVQQLFNEYQQADPDLGYMGTTWTSAYIIAPYVMIIHIGDSRAYVFQEDHLVQLTRDHTLKQELIDEGFPPEDVMKYGHVLLNYIGGGEDEDDVHADVHQLQIDSGSRLLLCSDGLSDMVPDDEIADLLRQGGPPDEACRQLVQMALDAGGKDNVTVVLADFTQLDDTR